MKRKKLTVDSVFNKFEDEDSDDMPRKRKLVPLDYGDEDKASSKGNVNTEEKRKHIKSLIEKIPTAKPELFAYPLDWSIVDSVSMKFYTILSVICKTLGCIIRSVCAVVPVHNAFPSSFLSLLTSHSWETFGNRIECEPGGCFWRTVFVRRAPLMDPAPV